MKHTKGAWEIEVGSYPNSYFLLTVVKEQEAKANAKLMAAAPLNFKELERSTYILEELQKQFGWENGNEVVKQIKRNKAAIKKATE